MTKILLIVFSLAGLVSYSQKYNGLAQTPPMGWNTWNTFKTKFDEEIIKRIADQIVDSRMKDAGYQYIVLDDGWMSMTRDSADNLVADPVKFPHGIKALAAYIHARGLKIGIYNCAGVKTCGGYPGSRGFEFQDAKLYASWDIDYLKLDWCNTEGLNAQEAYRLMSEAIRAAGRPMIFSICEWGTNQPWLWAADLAQLWRTTQDIYNCFDCFLDHGTWYWAGPMRIIDLENDLRKYSGPGHWNDPDMLEVGNGLSAAEDRSHFSMWCMLAAPLIAGNDLRHMTNETLQILTNPDAISIDQYSLGIQGFRYQKEDSLEVWVKPLKDQKWAVAFLNRSVKSR